MRSGPGSSVGRDVKILHYLGDGEAMQFKRTDRLGEVIKHEISRIVQGELRDPRVGFVTITGVSLSPDLHQARVFVSVLGGQEEASEALKGLQNAAPFIRRLLAARIKSRYTPELEFRLDQSLEYGAHLEQLYHEIENQRKKENLDLPET